MLQIGKYHTLQVIKEVEFGLYLSDDNRIEEILLPIKYVPSGTEVGDKIEVFLYNDSENRPIATSLKPIAVTEEFALLTVISVEDFGAFLDLGIAKDIFVPIKEQAYKMRVGRQYAVYLYIDTPSGRIAASSKWNKFLEKNELLLKEEDEVQMFIIEQTDLGYKAIINNRHVGLIYANEIFEPLQIGDKKKGFIKKIRDGNKIDLSLQAQGYKNIDITKINLVNILKANKGFLPLGDNSTPDEIQQKVNLSKKAFKKTIGGLYKEGIIDITEKGITLIMEE